MTKLKQRIELPQLMRITLLTVTDSEESTEEDEQELSIRVKCLSAQTEPLIVEKLKDEVYSNSIATKAQQDLEKRRQDELLLREAKRLKEKEEEEAYWQNIRRMEEIKERAFQAIGDDRDRTAEEKRREKEKLKKDREAQKQKELKWEAEKILERRRYEQERRDRAVAQQSAAEYGIMQRTQHYPVMLALSRMSIRHLPDPSKAEPTHDCPQKPINPRGSSKPANKGRPQRKTMTDTRKKASTLRKK